MKSASEIDAEFASDKQFEAAMGEDGMKKMEELEAACVESRQTNLFVIDPKMSNPSRSIDQSRSRFLEGEAVSVSWFRKWVVHLGAAHSRIDSGLSQVCHGLVSGLSRVCH